MLLFIGILVLAGLLYFCSWKENEPYTKPPQNTHVTENKQAFISCGCPELATWHPGRVKHKLGCKKFWDLNPGRTEEELLKDEGF